MSDQNELNHDNDMLQFLQKSVYDGSIPKPKPNEGSKIRLQSKPLSMHIPVPSPPPTPGPASPAALNRTPDLDLPVSIQTPPSAPRLLRQQAYHVLWPIPISSYAHAPTCFHNPNATFSTKSSTPSVMLATNQSVLLTQDKQHAATMASLRREASRRWDAGDYNVAVERRLRDMKDELTASRVAKGVFFRRCNGVFMNALGWIWSDDGEGKPEKDEKDDLVSYASSDEDDETAVTNRVAEHCRVDGVVGDVNGKSESDQTQKEDDQHSSKGQPSNASPTNKDKHSNLPVNLLNQFNHGELEPQPRDEYESSNQAEHPAQPNHPPPSPPTPKPTQIHNQSPTPPPPIISPPRLRARENLALAPNLTDEDLIITCWAWNQHAKSQARPHESSPHRGHP